MAEDEKTTISELDLFVQAEVTKADLLDMGERFAEEGEKKPTQKDLSDK